VHRILIYSYQTCLKGRVLYGRCSEIAKALTAAWIRTEGTNKSIAKTAEFSVPFITNLSVKPNKPGVQEVSPWALIGMTPHHCWCSLLPPL
jgi:hypothetical protein